MNMELFHQISSGRSLIEKRVRHPHLQDTDFHQLPTKDLFKHVDDGTSQQGGEGGGGIPILRC